MRHLLYVPMIHRYWECEYPYSHLSPEEQATAEEYLEEFLDRYWQFILKALLQKFETLDVVDDSGLNVDLFCEGWTSLDDAQQGPDAYDEEAGVYAPTVRTLCYQLMKIGARPRVTESSELYELEGLANKSREQGERSEYIVPRDQHIAAQLNAVTAEQGVALLCMGAGHDVPRYLDQDWHIDVIAPGELPELLNEHDFEDHTWMRIFQAQGLLGWMLTEEERAAE